jgi:hypothetical protein
MYKKLKTFYEKHGHIGVTKNMDVKLNRWLIAQEEKSSISKERRKKLEALGMVWKKERNKKREIQWSSMFLKLKKFYIENGHQIIPLKNRALFNWVKNVRAWNKELTDDQRRKLKSINFDFYWQRDDYVSLKWEQRYEELAQFVREFGHCRISKHDPEYASLGLWIGIQRRRKKSLTAEQIKKLDKLNFDWGKNSLFKSRWEERYEELKKFRQEFGHSNPKRSTQAFTQLSNWVYNQRKDKLSAEQIKKLNQLGFVWKK